MCSFWPGCAERPAQQHAASVLLCCQAAPGWHLAILDLAFLDKAPGTTDVTVNRLAARSGPVSGLRNSLRLCWHDCASWTDFPVAYSPLLMKSRVRGQV